jgi:tetratricopeptide (TPR) repeat protein
MDDVAAIARPGAVAQYHRSISLLRKLGVPTATLAHLFHTSPENIRKVDSRAYEGDSVDSPPLVTDLLREFADDREWEVLRRKSPLADKLRNRKRLEAVERELSAKVAQYAKSEQFSAGARALRLFLPLVANATHPEVLRIRALVHRHLAWFSVHNGQSERAIDYAREAMRAALSAFDASLGDRRFLKEYTEAALITSNALRISHRTDEVFSVLDNADAAVLALERKLGSEHYRQRATALFQKGEDEAALNLFQAARFAAEQTGNQHQIEIQMTSDRQSNVIRPGKGLARAFDLSEGTKLFFGPQSLEYVMAIHWAAAAALSTDSDSEIKEALRLVREAAPVARQFGHQATTNFLLSITHELNLPLLKRRIWIRFLLYENSFRSK